MRHGSTKNSLNQIALEISVIIRNRVRNAEILSFEEVKSVKGIGNVQSIEILALVELTERFSLITDNQPITPNYIFQDLFEARNSKKEKFYAYYLDARNLLIKRELISVGTVDSSLVHPREVFEPAIKSSAVSLIIAHNHPSGNVEPSNADIEITEVLKDSGTLLGIKLKDHIIVAKDKFYSFKENNLLF